MAFTENIIEHGKYADGTFSYYAEIICDTVADIPDPAAHPNWEVGSKLLVLESGGTQYRLSNARKWVQVNFNTGGEGGDAGSALLRSKNIKIYVNAATGSDSNDGLSASNAFATLGRALDAAAVYAMSEIVIAQGEYAFPSSPYSVYGGDIRISGAGADATTLIGKLSINSANFELSALTVDTSADTSTSSAITVIHGGTVRISDAVINAPTAGNGIYVGNMGYVFAYNVVINGTTQRMVYVTNDGRATLQTVSGTTDSTRENVMTGAAGFTRIVASPDLTYSTNYTGVVFVDGVQRSPSATAASSTNENELMEDETFESDVLSPSVETTETADLTPMDTKTTDTDLV